MGAGNKYTLPQATEQKQVSPERKTLDFAEKLKEAVEVEIVVGENGDIKKEDDDPYKLPDLPNNTVKWQDLNNKERVKWVVTSFGKIVGLLALLYMFVCTLDFLSSAFRLLGGKAVGEALGNSVLLSNPVAGLMVGVLATVLVQSSSTSTTIVVSMISADILTVQLAIPIIMGANIGTTVTNYIVAMGQTGDRNHFRRSYAAATVHDMFNWMCVVILLPVEVASSYLYTLSGAVIDSLPHRNGTVDEPDFLKAITKPFTSYIISIDSKVISQIAQGNAENITTMVKGGIMKDIGWSDTNLGILLLILSLVVLCTCLVLIVKLLHSVLSGKIAKIIRRIVNANSKGFLGYLTGFLAILIGAGLTFLVQSSSIFTSACTPLVGLGIIHIDRMYPLTLGANIGTTGTSLLAAFASAGSGNFDNSLQIALCHLFFNFSGVFVFYIIYPMRKLPINAAKYMGNVTANHRWFAIVYLILMYFLLPGIVFVLSLAGWQVLLGVGIPALVLIIVIIIMNLIQWKAPGVLPEKYRTWDFLPSPMHSLDPYDSIFNSIKDKLPCRQKREELEKERNDNSPVYVKTIS